MITDCWWRAWEQGCARAGCGRQACHDNLRGERRRDAPLHQVKSRTTDLTHGPAFVHRPGLPAVGGEAVRVAQLSRRPTTKVAGLTAGCHASSGSCTSEDAGPALFWSCNVAPPTLFPPCLWSSETVVRPSFSITENLQVVPQHSRTCCQAFNIQFMRCCP